MAKDNREIEDRVMKAFDKVQSETRPNLAKIAREFDVPYNRLRLRVQGKKSLFGRPANGRKLDLAQEKALGDWLEYNDNLGLSVKHNDIIAAASSIMRLSNPSGSLSSGPLLSERWMQRWLQRYPEYRTQNRKAPSAERLRAHDKSTIESWFQRFQDFIEKYDIQHEDFYNYGETSFQLGASEDQWIITREPHNKFASGIHEKGEYVTVLEAISADGFIVPPLVILAAEQAQPPSIWSKDPRNDRIHVTETGCITETLALKWIQDFEESTRSRTKGSWRMVLCDGLTSHVNLEMVKYCEDKKIKLFFIPPHTSSILQPLDVGVSNAHENRQSESIEAATATGSTKLTIVDFLTGIESIQSKSFTKNTALLGFELSGCWPFNPAIVCDKLVEYTPPVRPPPPTNTINPTPLNASTITIQRFQKIEDRLLSRLSEYDNLVKKLTQGAHDCVCQLQEVQREIEAMKAVALAHRTT